MDIEDAVHLAYELLSTHGLSQWALILDLTLPDRLFGTCEPATRTIRLSPYHTMTNTAAEIAHALEPRDFSHGAL